VHPFNKTDKLYNSHFAIASDHSEFDVYNVQINDRNQQCYNKRSGNLIWPETRITNKKRTYAKEANNDCSNQHEFPEKEAEADQATIKSISIAVLIFIVTRILLSLN